MTRPGDPQVTPRLLQAVLRSFADIGPPVSDAELLHRFIHNDQDAFAELVRRHGRLVWAACRNMTRSEADAEDAFQATFLVLLQNAARIRHAGKLSPWLYGVAHKVCANARRGGSRRAARERASSTRERNGDAIAESAWDRALAAVHVEAASLPESLRTAFVLCCLEGKGVSEAAEQVGCKLGTFSSRLTRAKDVILARLEARGLTLGVVAAVGLASPPAGAVARAAAIARPGFVAPGTILQLSQGVIGMSMKSVKMLAAAVILTCGLGLGVGSRWASNAEAQQPQPKPPTSKAEIEAEIKRLQSQLAQAQMLADAEAAFAQAMQSSKREEPTFSTKKWDYDQVVVSDLDQLKFRVFLQDREDRGWEFIGTTVTYDPRHLVWMFRRPAKVAAADARKTRAELTLTDATVRKAAAFLVRPSRTTYQKADLPLDANELAGLLRKVAEKRFGSQHISIKTDASALIIEGDSDIVTWLDGVVKKLNEK